MTSLATLTGFSRVADLRMKNVKVMKAIIAIAINLGEYLDESWCHVMKCISQIEKLSASLIGDVTNDTNGIDVGKNGTYDNQVLGLISNAKSDAVIEEMTGQSFVLQADQMFSQSVGLSSAAILSFFQAMCTVSLEEVGFTTDSKDLRDSAVLAQHVPRIYLLQKIVEVAYYNIERIRFEWAQIWRFMIYVIISF